MGQDTICEYACEPEERQLISTENAAVVTKDGSKHNGGPLCTICLIQLVLDQFYEQQLVQMDTQSNINESQGLTHSSVIRSAQRNGLCAAVWPS